MKCVSNKQLKFYKHNRVNKSDKFGGVNASFALFLCLTSFVLVACQPKSANNEKVIEQKQALADEPANSLNTLKTELDIQVDAKTDYAEASYNTHLWQENQTNNAKPLSINNLTDILSELGQLQKVDKNSLDYDGNYAKKYRFADLVQPAYLDVIDSKNYFELQWYYANKKDTLKEQQTSIKNAKTAFNLAKKIMPTKGGMLIKRMLTGQRIQQTVLNGQKVVLAECALNRCSLVIQKKS